jgi:DNA-binding NarL/FixJ family response regulator
MINVVIADDHRLMREGLRQIFNREPDIAVVGEATNDIDVMFEVRKGGIDVITMDLTMPGRSGIELIRRVREEAPELPVLILTMHDEQHYAVRAIRAGAQGYLTKENAGIELIDAIRQLAEGKRYISAKVAEQLALNFMAPHAGMQHSALSDRELQVFSLLVAGISVSAAAADLMLSVKTVSAHKARILQKMGMSNLSEMVQYAVTHKLL